MELIKNILRDLAKNNIVNIAYLYNAKIKSFPSLGPNSSLFIQIDNWKYIFPRGVAISVEDSIINNEYFFLKINVNDSDYEALTIFRNDVKHELWEQLVFTTDNSDGTIIKDSEKENTIFGATFFGELKRKDRLDIKKVIFNPPATIVIFNDGTKTVVKCHDETFDQEKGLLMCIIKHQLGNKSNFNNVINRYIENAEGSKLDEIKLYADHKRKPYATLKPSKKKRGKKNG